MLKLFTDSDCDITPTLAKEYGYNLIIMPYTVDGKDVYPYIDYDEFDYKKFYDTLRKGTLPTTSALNPNKYIEYFEPVFKNGDDILYVHFSKQMSGTFNSLNLALEELKEKYPERKFYTIDTKAITIGAFSIALEVAKLYKENKSKDEILKWAQENVEKFTVYFFAEDLKFFQRSGRVSGLSATMGTIVGIRPIMFMDSDGVMKTVGKEFGRKKALRRLLSYVEELGDDIQNHKIVIGHSDMLDAAEELKNMITERFGNSLDIMTFAINPTIGSHCGPSALGVSFHSIHR